MYLVLSGYPIFDKLDGMIVESFKTTIKHQMHNILQIHHVPTVLKRLKRI